ncbi:hypothetical protein M409DRAFT_61345 [Zasmidium cellare ATCC 36951]|uniref:SnoaL-like domain-containing protein n=1 Tax=Zasmidium cellare ATCC 36951 TaxID=1080233 RepID=A0A6A6BZ27_ZASCE|nr:uncharacterized protein M409DRAFT_61345 [Zasmidium cellare ATCC 36951]KAF2158842.1 hypothetical protein M409DRAFT_61345 [Zasmidium cellare ATCC 36951]
MAPHLNSDLPPTNEKSANTISVADHVKSITLDLLTEINTGTFSKTSPMWPYISDDFSIAGTTAGVATKEATLLHVQELHRKSPAYHVHVTNARVEVNHKLAVATVWVNLKCGGLPQGLTKDVVSVFDFRRDRQGEWLAVGVTNMLGPGVEDEV